ncbi:MAG: hypothetical protein KKA73_13680 [Chloroflexi bacterium]|nr:hypothetical protein [Chloroflexota bacterium]
MWSSILYDWILASQEAIAELQWWLGLLEGWQQAGGASREEFNAAYQQLQEAGLRGWGAHAAGHGIAALAAAVVTVGDGDGESTTHLEAFPPVAYRR